MRSAPVVALRRYVLRRMGLDENLRLPSVGHTLRRFLPFILPYRWPILAGMLMTVVAVGLGKLSPLLARWLVDRVLTPVLASTPPLTPEGLEQARRGVWLFLAGSLAIGAGTTLTGFLRTYLLRKAGQSMVHDLRVSVYRHVQRLSLSFFDSRPTGDTIARITGDVDQVEQLVTNASDTLLADLLNLVGTLVVLFYLSWRMTLVALIPVPALLLLIVFFMIRIRPIYRHIRRCWGDLSARLQENLTGIRVVKAFGREAHEADQFRTSSHAYYQANLQGIRLWTWFFPFIGYLHSVGVILVVAYGAFLALRPQPQASLGDLFAFSIFVPQFYQPIGNLFRIYDVLLRAAAAGERLVDMLETEPEVRDVPDALELERVEGRVCFQEVSFRYRDGQEALSGISLEALPGQTIALVGRSGAGKTTIINLLARFYDPTDGRVLVDGHDLRTVTQESLRNQIAMVLQEVFLFNGSVRDNIRYGRLDAARDEILAASRAANAHQFIEALPEGYETQIGERGIKLSGGQRQRLAIARAVLADPRILILDEATSMVDSESEHLIQEALERLLEGRTAFVIAHRLSTVRRADRIIVLEDGRIVEEGGHEELLQRDGLYAAMYAMQFRLGEEEEMIIRERLRQWAGPQEDVELVWGPAPEGLNS